MTQMYKIPCAAIDIGSNSTELAVARCSPENLELLKDESQMLRTGEDVKANGEIGQETRARLISLLNDYVRLAKRRRARVFLVVATEAMREARNGQEVAQEIERESGLHVHIIPGTLEAALTYHGATSDPSVPADAGVLDVGGGSTEVVTARQRKITWLTSLPIGSGWLHDQFLTADPPMQEEIEEAQDFLHRYLRALYVPHFPLTLMVTGSSAKSLLKVAQQALKLDVESDCLTRKALFACLGILRTLSAREVADRYGLEVERASVLPGGALILLEMLAYLRLDEARVSPAGVREGMLLAYGRFGDEWLEHPEVRVDEERIGQSPPLPEEVAHKPEATRPFAQAGQDELVKRARKFVDWRDEVLKHDDVEAVHKMRVASRRLRAAMDAYQSTCQEKRFKRAYRQVRQAADLLGAARDTDVMRLRVEELAQRASTEEQPGLRWLSDRLTAYRRQGLEDLEAFFQEFDANDFQDEIEDCIPTGGNSNG